MSENNSNISVNDFFFFWDFAFSDEDNFFHITTQKIAETMSLICNNFQNSVLLQFMFNTENINNEIINNLYITLGLEVFPDVDQPIIPRCVNFFFKDIIELSYNYKKNYKANNENTIEIEINSFEVSEDFILFSFHSKNDKSKLFTIKAKKLLVNIFLHPDDEYYEDEEEYDDEEDEDNEDDECLDTINTMSLSVKERAWYFFNKEDYDQCMHILKYEYFDLEKDADANYLLSMCILNKGNKYYANIYIDKAIALDKTKSVYFYIKSKCLETDNLSMEYIENIKTAIDLADKEEDSLKYSQALNNYITTRLENYTLKLLEDNEKFNLYILAIDTMINLNYCFPGITTKYKKMKNDAINYYYNETYNIFNSPGIPGKSYKALASRCNTLLKIQDLSATQKTAIQNLLHECNKLVKQFEDKKYTFTSSSFADPWEKPYLIQDMMSSGMSKSEMIEQISVEYGVSEESAEASLNAYYRNDDLGLRDYFNNRKGHRKIDSNMDNEDNYDDESWA